MNRKKSEVLRLIHNCLWLYTLVYFLGDCLSTWSAEPGATYALPILPVLAYSLLISRKGRRLWSAILLQLPALLGAMMLGNYLEAGFPFVFPVLLLQGCLLAERRSPLFGPLCPSPAMLAYYVLLYFLGLFYGCHRFCWFAAVALMGEILLYVLYENHVGLEDFLGVRQNVQNLPYSQIRQGNRIWLSGVVMALLVIFILSSFFMDDSPLIALGVGILSWIRSLLRRLLNQEELPQKAPNPLPQLPQETLAEETGTLLQETTGSSAISPFWDRAALILLLLLGICLLAALIRGLWKLLMMYFAEAEQRERVKEKLADEITDLRREKREGGISAHETLHPARKSYKRQIRRKRRENRRRAAVNPAYNPSQIEEDSVYCGELSPQEQAHWQELHAMYEAERYGRKSSKIDPEALK